jgi:hypothetical protein
MKIFKFVFFVPVLIIFAAMSGTTLSSCNKNMTDTVYVRHDSAIYVYDTTTLHDTVYDITSGLVAYYNFNGGNLNDSSGYNNKITFSNATPTTDRYGRANNAYLFDGATSYMTVANSPSLNPDNITIYAIVKVNGFYYGTDHGNFILVKGWDLDQGMYFMDFTDYKSLGLPDTTHEYFQGAYGDNTNPGSASGAIDSSSYVVPGSWHKLTYTFDGFTAKIYDNGVLAATTMSSVTFTPNSDDLFFGKNDSPNNLYPYWFNGVIDEIRIYNRALPPQAVAELNNLTD